MEIPEAYGQMDPRGIELKKEAWLTHDQAREFYDRLGPRG
jgi:hypothetical protein